ncbi:adenosylcobinamide-phosphate synthase CbiB [Anaerotalea alkaliphila]|uniref:Cobalamin biosynthesis protein CobD n=1 Tax=Anaerotalea alkaliphila TaxID=2662126 RepID=A0A7X5HX88_9FIRM|nr:adenosylcobinamide-phosphate synthase CbiB [Anaerotalea alkaliphila]NDL68349.1 cobalamin biosynthesis protein CobD [Anaerotalea alkaliphila]
MEIIIAITAGCILDFLFGDPRWLPHPIRLIGWMINKLEKVLRKGCKTPQREYMGGVVLTVLTVTAAFVIPFFILYFIGKVNVLLKTIVETIMCFQIIAAKSLKTESNKVYDELAKGDVASARQKLSWLVSRDTDSLDESGIVKSTVETIAENTSDGVIAPLVYMLIGGAPLGFLYKAVNTLDSMVGYKNDTYVNFGRFAAKLDDLANYIPARLSAYAMIAASAVCRYDWKGAARVYARDKRNHASPNSAHTEAVCAGALGIQIAGPNYYFGKMVDKPTIGDDTRSVEVVDMKRANKLMYCTFIIVLMIGVLMKSMIILGW